MASICLNCDAEISTGNLCDDCASSPKAQQKYFVVSECEDCGKELSKTQIPYTNYLARKRNIEALQDRLGADNVPSYIQGRIIVVPHNLCSECQEVMNTYIIGL